MILEEKTDFREKMLTKLNIYSYLNSSNQRIELILAAYEELWCSADNLIHYLSLCYFQLNY